MKISTRVLHSCQLALSISRIRSFGQEDEEKVFSQRRIVVEPIVRVTDEPDTEDETDVEEVIAAAAAAAVEDAPGELGIFAMVRMRTESRIQRRGGTLRS